MLEGETKDDLQDHNVDIDEIKQDFQKLIKNEEIPDWYLIDGKGKNSHLTFDIE